MMKRAGPTAPRGIERVWWGTDALARAARVALLPLEAAYASAVAVRGVMYDAGLLRTQATALPTVSIGNLSVGGTGKTPIAAWVAKEFEGRGAQPAIVLRGYGADEPLVHSVLNPSVPVVVDADRVQGVARAAVLGADVAVLDDAFQHRRAGRAADVVLVSAERWSHSRRLLPAGPWREPLGALRRATLVIVTRKSSPAADAAAVATSLSAATGGGALAVVHLAVDALHDALRPGQPLPIATLRDAPVFAVAAIGDPTSFLRQLREVGATVRPAIFPDHYRFTAADALRLATAAGDGERIVCTLKDAVKLAPQWPREAPPFWYVSQRVVVERGGDAIAAVIEDVLRARSNP
jgi:tetraacyldisaccharide 4'-kinase